MTTYDIPNNLGTEDDILSTTLKENFDYIEGILNSFDGGNITDGTLPDAAFVTSPETIRDETLTDQVVSGCTSADPGATLTATVASGLAYIEGVRVSATSYNHTYTASKDCYVDLDKNGSWHTTEVANGAAEPALYTNSTRICKFVTNATEITSYTDKRTRYLSDWTTWTPTWTNLTIGNATVTARYIQRGKTVDFVLNVTLGNTSSVGTLPCFSLPFGSSSAMFLYPTQYTVSGAHIGLAYTSGSSCYLTVGGAGTTYVSRTSVSATVPGTWTTGDYIRVSGTYEAQ